MLDYGDSMGIGGIILMECGQAIFVPVLGFVSPSQ